MFQMLSYFLNKSDIYKLLKFIIHQLNNWQHRDPMISDDQLIKA